MLEGRNRVPFRPYMERFRVQGLFVKSAKKLSLDPARRDRCGPMGNARWPLCWRRSRGVCFVTVDAPVREIAEAAGLGWDRIPSLPQRSDLIAAVFQSQVKTCADAAAVISGIYEPAEALSP